MTTAVKQIDVGDMVDKDRILNARCSVIVGPPMVLGKELETYRTSARVVSY